MVLEEILHCTTLHYSVTLFAVHTYTKYNLLQSCLYFIAIFGFQFRLILANREQFFPDTTCVVKDIRL